MKTIGLVDYYINEWHANNYPKWIKEISENTGKDFVVKYAWAEKDVAPVGGMNTDEWCKEHDIEKCDTIEELCKKSDYIIVLAPANPEKHLEYAEQVLKFNKNTYIDKTFAPDYKTAKKIFELGNEYGTPFFSTSALRYASELADFKECQSAIVMGDGVSFDEYIIHLVEIAVKIMGIGCKRVRTINQIKQNVCTLDYGDGKMVTLNFATGMPYALSVCNKEGQLKFTNLSFGYFKNLMHKILEFFETGKSDFDGAETLEVMKIIEKLIEAKGKEGAWLAL
ncbi:MAG: hypothetical protein E7346_06775 [Clostridiales bacterium]|nr:hypothetical protein [Clostridiales bacterium]